MKGERRRKQRNLGKGVIPGYREVTRGPSCKMMGAEREILRGFMRINIFLFSILPFIDPHTVLVLVQV